MAVKFGGHLLVALIVLVVGRWIALWVGRATRTLVSRSRVDETAATFVSDVVYTLLLAFAIVSALGWIGFDTTSFAAVIAAAGLAVGLALQGTLSNFASGILLILYKPFKAGDSIEVGTSAGTVEEVHVFSTLLRTADNVRIVVPNSQITQGAIKNLSATGTRRIELLIHVNYDDDLQAVKRLIEELLLGEDRVLKDPKPAIVVNDLVELGVQIAIRPWVKTADYGDVRSALAERIKDIFAQRKFRLARK